MSETQPDLREAPYRVGRRVPRSVYFEFEPLFMAATAEQARKLTDVLNAGHAALAQVSALQAEVEEARQDAREAGHNGGHLLHQLDQAKVKIRRLSAEVERLQKVEGERDEALAQVDFLRKKRLAAAKDIREQAAKVCDEAAAYFLRTTGHYDRAQARGSYIATAATIRGLTIARSAVTETKEGSDV